jgi:hypothetical protein
MGDALYRTARQMEKLLEANALFSILKFSSVGVVQMRGDGLSDRGCSVEEVLAKLTAHKPGARVTLNPAHALILLWGRVYVEGPQVYLRSYLRFVGGTGQDVIRLALGACECRMRLPGQSVAFAPAALSVSELAAIEREFQRTAVVRDRPTESAPGQPVPEGEFGYSVTEWRGDWMRISPFGAGPAGWVRAGVEIGDAPLRHKLPELSFVEGLTGFLRSHIAPQQAAQMRTMAVAAFERYLTDAGQTSSELAAAVAKGAVGILKAEGGEAQAAISYFRDAGRLAPFNSDARNMGAVGAMVDAYNGVPNAPAWQQISDELVSAAEADPADGSILRNLEAFYTRLLKSGPPAGQSLSYADRAGVSGRLATVNQLLAQAPPR